MRGAISHAFMWLRASRMHISSFCKLLLLCSQWTVPRLAVDRLPYAHCHKIPPNCALKAAHCLVIAAHCLVMAAHCLIVTVLTAELSGFLPANGRKDLLSPPVPRSALAQGCPELHLYALLLNRSFIFCAEKELSS